MEKLSARLDAVVLVAATEEECREFESYLWLSARVLRGVLRRAIRHVPRVLGVLGHVALLAQHSPGPRGLGSSERC